MGDTFQLRHKKTGFITEHVTLEQAKGIAGFPADYEKLVPPKPLVVKDAAPKKATASKPAAGKPRATKPKAAAKPAPTPAPAPAGDTETQD